ncbi:MAG: cyclophilin-like fold protein [Verrucomicrobia bacterium]|nr:cyclophilin-like fold protein [Verrucomicrobiota bacterium]
MGTSTQIKITAGQVSLAATLNDSETARLVVRALPIEARANRWGDEIYFTITVAAGEENPQEVVAAGDLAYWPPGRAFCIFFGPTPASVGDEPRAASPVNVVGRVVGDAAQFRQVRDGEPVKIELA